MNTPKEKADEIVKAFWMQNKNGQDSYENAIKNAKLSIELLIDNAPNSKLKPLYWEQVKNELKIK